MQMDFEQLPGQIIDFILFFIPFAIFYGLIVFIYKTWVDFAQTKFDAKQKKVLLRIYPPKLVTKTPAAMELFLNAIYQTGGETNWYDKKVLGKQRAVFSLEIASHSGEVAFYIRTRAGLRREVETQIYAQYPGIEVVESEDYTEKINFDEHTVFGVEWRLTDKDPLPIKTYVDYGLDKPAEEEEKVDPITNTLEFFGSLKRGENIWLQIIVKAHKKEDKDPESWFGNVDNWKEEAKQLIQEIRDKSAPKNADGTPGFPNPTKGEIEKINAIERSVSKPGFDCGIRGLYIAKPDAFEGTTTGALIGTFKQYNSLSLNGFGPQNTSGTDYPWQSWFGNPSIRMAKQIFEDYKSRTYFGTTFVGINYFGFKKWKDRKKFILNAEELATIYHFPGQSANTPSLKRVQSRKGEAPENLPI